MYPQNYFGLWPAFPRNHQVFVAMSFDDTFQSRWENVIQPAIRSVQINGVSLEPHRVDTRIISNSILTEILDGISNDRLIFSDLSTLGHLAGRPVRNGNVMYEIGLAHAVRQPEEVLIFRSDRDALLFDLANVRINEYEPDAFPVEARAKLQAAILDCLKEIDLRKNLAVKIAAESLDYDAYMLLLSAHQEGGLKPLNGETVIQALAKSSVSTPLSRLLELNALATVVEKASLETLKGSVGYNQMFRYQPTAFGTAVLQYIIAQHQFTDEMVEYISQQEQASEL